MSLDDENPENYEKFYGQAFSGNFVFLVETVKVMDLDSDGRHEVVVNWLTYDGGDLGARYSTVIHLSDDGFKMFAGQPEVLSVRKSKAIWGFQRSLGWLDHRRGVNSKIPMVPISSYKELLDLDESEIAKYKRVNTTSEKNHAIEEVFGDWQHLPKSILIDLDSREEIKMWGLSLYDFGRWINIDNEWIYAVSFFGEDENCLWCPHDWRLMAFKYNEGRWSSDRGVNGNLFLGRWLSDTKAYSINDVFGTYPDQNVLGTSWSFVLPSWSVSKVMPDDVLGQEVLMRSPVEKKLKSIYSEIED